MEIDQIPQTGFPPCTVSDRLRWTSDFLNLAAKAITIVACAKGLNYPPDLHVSAQHDLRAWALYLDDHPAIAAELESGSASSAASIARR
jgi:hypothetical protein